MDPDEEASLDSAQLGPEQRRRSLERMGSESFGLVVVGGGVMLLRAQAAVEAVAAKSAKKAPDEATGARIVAKSLEAPLHQIAVNAGLEGGVVVEKVRNLTGAKELLGDLYDYGQLRLFRAGHGKPARP